MDFKELNCSDFRGIDTIRRIRDTMHLAPVGKVKIWLLDEFHMTTKEAQNAALKMLEDTPNHVYFFLCTTDPQKLLKTIRTRSCDMPVSSLPCQDLTTLIQRVLRREKKDVEESVVDEIVNSCEGSARSALVMLDKVLNLPPEQREEAIQQVKAEESEGIELCRALIKKADWAIVGKILQNLKGEPESIRYSVLMYARSVLLKKKNIQAYNIICAFENNFYDSKKAGLARACFEAIYG